MAETLDPCSFKTSSLSLFHGSSIMSLVRYGMKVAPVACDFRACALVFEKLKSP
jgi:hypothetical protein